MNKGDKYCNKCFNEREKSASNVAQENTNYSFHPSPFLGTNSSIIYFNPLLYLGIIGFNKIKNWISPDKIIYHVYINGNHEKWNKYITNNYNLQKCKKCCEFSSIYYEFESLV